MQQFQTTLKSSVVFEGIGVHSGKPSRVVLLPADADHGIVFYNQDNREQKIVIGKVVPEVAMHATVIKTDGWFVSTLEHLMAALYVLGVDNLRIEVQGYEVPILDGSALPFAQGILDVGLTEQSVLKRYLTPKMPLTFNDNAGRSIIITPALKHDNNFNKDFIFDYSADFNHPLIGQTQMQGKLTHDFFMHDIAPARTFGFLQQLPFLRQHNLACGTSLGNTVVIGDELLNDMRLPSECIRHKVLDLIGDLSLLGLFLIGTVKAHKTSHSFNRLVIQHFINNPEQWELV